MTCGATVAKRGTFCELILMCGDSAPKHQKYTLEQCMAYIGEMVGQTVAAEEADRCLAFVDVSALRSGEITLKIHGPYAKEWQTAFPQLATLCEPTEEEGVLRVCGFESTLDLTQVREFCNKHLWTRLHWAGSGMITSTRWLVPRVVPDRSLLPREAYYFLASFILGSVVRYEPEHLWHDATPGTDLHWIIRRYLSASVRYFPNLLLNRLYGQNLFLVAH
jgi:hypothetical protein